MLSMFLLAKFIDSFAKDQTRLEREEIMGYVGGITCRTVFFDDVTVFGIFLVVRSPLQQGSSFLKGWYRTDTCRCYISSGMCTVSVIAMRPCHT